MQIETSALESLPVVMFFNTMLNERSVWIFTKASLATKAVELLEAMIHITEIEMTDAPVKTEL